MAFGRKKNNAKKDRAMSTAADGNVPSGNNKIRSASFYVWYLGARECRSLRGDDQVVPWIEELADADANNGKMNKLAAAGKIEQPPMKLTIELSNKGMKMLQHLTRRKGGQPTNTASSANPIAKVSFTTETVKHFIPSSCITYVKQGAPPYDDIVGVILLIYNPLTRCPVHAHVYRCDSAKTAESMTRKLDKMSLRANNNMRDAQLAQLEARLQERGLLPTPPALPPPPPPPKPVIPPLWRSYLPDPPELSMKMMQLQSTPTSQHRTIKHGRTVAEVLQNTSSSRYYLQRPEETVGRKEDVEQPSHIKRYYLTPDYQRWYAIEREEQEVTQNFSDSDSSSTTSSSNSTNIETDVRNAALKRATPTGEKINTVFKKSPARAKAAPTPPPPPFEQPKTPELSQRRGRLIIPPKDYTDDGGRNNDADSWQNILKNIRLRRGDRNQSSPPPDDVQRNKNDTNVAQMRRSASMQYRTGFHVQREQEQNSVADLGLGGSSSSSSEVAADTGPRKETTSHYETPKSVLTHNKQPDGVEGNRNAHFSDARQAMQKQILTFAASNQQNPNRSGLQRFMAGAQRTASAASSGYSSTSPVGGANQNNSNSQIVAEPTVKPSSLLKHVKSMREFPGHRSTAPTIYNDDVIPESVPPLRAPDAFNQFAAAIKQQHQTDRHHRSDNDVKVQHSAAPVSASAAYRPRHYYFNDDAAPTAASHEIYSPENFNNGGGVPLNYSMPFIAQQPQQPQPQQMFAMPTSPPRHHHQHQPYMIRQPMLIQQHSPPTAHFVRRPPPHTYAPTATSSYMPPTIMMATSSPSYQMQRPTSHTQFGQPQVMTYGHSSWQPTHWPATGQAPAVSGGYYPAAAPAYIVY